MNEAKIEEILTSLGYKLQDRGRYWQTSAIYRNGDNKTALQIYKDTGIWKDYVEQSAFMPFEKLLKVTLKTNSDEEIKKYKIKDDFFELKHTNSQRKIEMEKTYPETCLKRLLPHYKFYNDKGIDTETLKLFKAGLATEGKMYQRFVFPIYNLNNQIHGFSGRDMAQSSDRPKWKHIGVKSKWIYPHLLSTDYVTKTQEVFLVESIGDLLNLYQNNIKNVFCTFGLEIPPSLISYLVGLNPEKIFICFNNDENSKYNSGYNACLKNFIKLQSFFDNHKVYIHLPLKNDFGDMKNSEIENWYDSRKNIDKNNLDVNIIKDINRLLKERNMPKTFHSSFKKFKKIYE